MSKYKNILIEDWERLGDLDKIYLQEDEEKALRDLEYMEFISRHKGKVIVEKSDTGKDKSTIVINSPLLPF